MERLRRWQKGEELVGAALERPAAERFAYLNQAGADDSDLRAEVESLLAAYRGADGFGEPSHSDGSRGPGCYPLRNW